MHLYVANYRLTTTMMPSYTTASYMPHPTCPRCSHQKYAILSFRSCPKMAHIVPLSETWFLIHGASCMQTLFKWTTLPTYPCHLPHSWRVQKKRTCILCSKNSDWPLARFGTAFLHMHAILLVPFGGCCCTEGAVQPQIPFMSLVRTRTHRNYGLVPRHPTHSRDRRR